MPRLSLIIPTFNRVALLERCLSAIFAQTFEDFEVVVANDGGEDGTLVLLAALAKRESRLKLLELQHGGRAWARNAAMQASVGQILVFVDDDVLLEPEALAKHVAFHELFPRCVAIGSLTFELGGLRRIRAPGSPIWTNFSGANASLPRQAFLEIGLFDETILYGEDLDFGFRLKQAGWQFRPLGAMATHVGPDHRDQGRGFEAGRTAARLAERYGIAVARQLGVSREILAIKRLYLNRWMDYLWLRNRNYAFERAYAQGAEEELRLSGSSEL